jgi:hypothetical protein
LALHMLQLYITSWHEMSSLTPAVITHSRWMSTLRTMMPTAAMKLHTSSTQTISSSHVSHQYSAWYIISYLQCTYYKHSLLSWPQNAEQMFSLRLMYSTFDCPCTCYGWFGIEPSTVIVQMFDDTALYTW